MRHELPRHFLTNQVNVHIVGAGGNGSQMLNGLARMNVSMLALGHPHGLDVTVWDQDLVSDANFGRSLFCRDDVGQPKSFVLVNRINNFFGLDWKAKHDNWASAASSGYSRTNAHILVGCVDTGATRAELQKAIADHQMDYWLDLGNEASVGQVVLGEAKKNRHDKDDRVRLPTVVDLFPDILTKNDGEPSCSLAGALQKQDLFINQTVATWGLNLLWQFFRNGFIEHHGYFINLGAGAVAPLPIDLETWKRLGFSTLAHPPKRKIVRVIKRYKGFDPDILKLECGHVARHSKAKKFVFCKECAAGVRIQLPKRKAKL